MNNVYLRLQISCLRGENLDEDQSFAMGFSNSQPVTRFASFCRVELVEQ